MKMDCPYCGQSLKGRLLRAKPATGERRFLPLRATPFCSLCHGELAHNPHPVEKLQLIFVAVPVIALQLLLTHPSVTFVVFDAFLLVLGLSGVAYVHFKYLRDWQRFSRKVPGAR